MPLPGRLLRSRLARLASFLEAPCCRLAPDAHKSHTPTPRNQRSGGPFNGLGLCGGVEASSARGLAVLELPDPSAACCLSGFAVVLLRRAMQNALPQQAYLSFRGNHLGLAGSCCDVFLLGSSPFLKSHFGDCALQAGWRSENSTQPAKIQSRSTQASYNNTFSSASGFAGAFLRSRRLPALSRWELRHAAASPSWAKCSWPAAGSLTQDVHWPCFVFSDFFRTCPCLDGSFEAVLLASPPFLKLHVADWPLTHTSRTLPRHATKDPAVRSVASGFVGAWKLRLLAAWLCWSCRTLQQLAACLASPWCSCDGQCKMLCHNKLTSLSGAITWASLGLAAMSSCWDHLPS